MLPFPFAGSFIISQSACGTTSHLTLLVTLINAFISAKYGYVCSYGVTVNATGIMAGASGSAGGI